MRYSDRACYDVHLFRVTARDLALKIRCVLKNENPLIADEDNVVRQRSAVHREEQTAVKEKSLFFVPEQGSVLRSW